MSIKSVLKTYSLYIVSAALLAATAGWYVTSTKLDHARQQIEIEQKGRVADRLAFVAASATAKANNLEEVKKINEENVVKAEVANDRYDALRKLYDANLVQYARDQATKRNSGTVRLSDHTITTDGSNVTSESSEISISFEDAGICAENTARIQSVKDWADSLKQQ